MRKLLALALAALLLSTFQAQALTETDGCVTGTLTVGNYAFEVDAGLFAPDSTASSVTYHAVEIDQDDWRAALEQWFPDHALAQGTPSGGSGSVCILLPRSRRTMDATLSAALDRCRSFCAEVGLTVAEAPLSAAYLRQDEAGHTVRITSEEAALLPPAAREYEIILLQAVDGVPILPRLQTVRFPGMAVPMDAPGCAVTDTAVAFRFDGDGRLTALSAAPVSGQTGGSIAAGSWEQALRALLAEYVRHPRVQAKYEAARDIVTDIRLVYSTGMDNRGAPGWLITLTTMDDQGMGHRGFTGWIALTDMPD